MGRKGEKNLAVYRRKGRLICAFVQNNSFTTEAPRARRRKFSFGGERPPNKKGVPAVGKSRLCADSVPEGMNPPAQLRVLSLSKEFMI
jgi:hypothetical protein